MSQDTQPIQHRLYQLGEVQRRTIEKLMDYLQADGLLRRLFAVEELFPLAGRR